MERKRDRIGDRSDDEDRYRRRRDADRYRSERGGLDDRDRRRDISRDDNMRDRSRSRSVRSDEEGANEKRRDKNKDKGTNGEDDMRCGIRRLRYRGRLAKISSRGMILGYYGTSNNKDFKRRALGRRGMVC
nr:hypothetical protein [Tanacetum cinerariifolium]